jgi:hypothetical protein
MSRKAYPLIVVCALALIAFAAAAAAQAPPPLDPEIIRERLADQKKPRREVKIEPAILDNYIGDYQILSYSVFTVTRKDDHLFIQLSGEDAVEIYPESTKKFFYKTVAAQISFITGANGRATALVLHQSGLEQTAQRIDPAEAQTLKDNFAKRLKGEAPLPGSEAALRHQIEGFLQGHPDLDAMSDDLAAVTRPQVPKIERDFALLGPLQSVSFLGVGSKGYDIYEAKLANGIVISRVLLAPDGKISRLLFQWGP